MFASRLSARACGFFLILAAAFSGPSLCGAENDAGDNIKPAELAGLVHPIFVQLQGNYSDEHMPGIIQRIDGQFGDKIRTQPTNYGQDDVEFLKKLIPYTVEFAQKYRDVARGPDSPDKPARILQAKKEYNDHVQSMINQDVAATTDRMTSEGKSQAEIKTAVAKIESRSTFSLPLASGSQTVPPVAKAPPVQDKTAGNTGGITPNKGAAARRAPAADSDQSALANALLESVRGAFGRGPHPGQDHAAGNASIPDLGAVIGLPSNNSDPSSLMGNVGDQLLKGDVSGALASASKAVEMGGGADALTLRGGIELDQQNYSKANQDAKNALKLNPSDPEAAAILHFSEGRVDGVSSDGPAGAKAGTAAAGAAGGSPSGGDGGGSFSNVGSGGEAGSFGGGLSPSAGDPSSPALARLSGQQAAKEASGALAMGDLGGALAFVNRALAQNPRDPALLNLRSEVRARQRDYAGAEADAKAGLELAPRDSALLRSLGFAQLREKDYEAAIATANKMLELNPNDPYAYALRGHAYGSLGDRDAMMADLKRAAELDPSFRDAAERLGGQLELPSDKDILFLFPGETAAAPAKTSAPAPGRGRRFGLVVGASALGGLLLALGLLATVLAPLKARVTSAFTRLTRTGPTLGAAVADEEAPPASVGGHLPGLVRGQYEISREIGRGGMGLVFAGLDRALGRPVAIKKMRDELRHDPQEKARFVAEAKTVAALHHPNVVDIYAIAEDGDDVFLVFEYVDGKTVHELLMGAGRLAPAEAARIARASAQALEYAHGRGVIHRDMKPSNVMLDRSGAIKVMDFGIARAAKDTMLRQSATNTVAGTPPYMAPEQEQGRARKESDVYSLAVCAYEMLTGKLPFVGSGGGMLLNKINMSYVPPSRQTAGLPEALDGVFERAFQADPDKRFRTPREFADALEAAALASARS